jgi:hypothetical protein
VESEQPSSGIDYSFCLRVYRHYGAAIEKAIIQLLVWRRYYPHHSLGYLLHSHSADLQSIIIILWTSFRAIQVFLGFRKAVFQSDNLYL